MSSPLRRHYCDALTTPLSGSDEAGVSKNGDRACTRDPNSGRHRFWSHWRQLGVSFLVQRLESPYCRPCAFCQNELGAVLEGYVAGPAEIGGC